MTDLQDLVMPFLAGALLGALYFTGLWWTVRKGLASETPALWFFGSLLLRTTLILAGFYVMSQGHWSRLVACLVGFLMARLVIVKRLARAPTEEEQTDLQLEADHAPEP